MGKSLAGAKVSFVSDLEKALKEAMEEAMYEAYMTQFSQSDDKDASNMNQSIQDGLKESAKKFSKEAADKFSQKASKSIADAIYNYVKEMTISINHMNPGTLVSAAGPVTGLVSILPSEVTIM